MNLGTMKETEGVVLNTSLEKSNVQTALVARKEVVLAPEKIDSMLAVIDTSDLSTITRFGADSTEALSRASDVVLANTSSEQMEKLTTLVKNLQKILKSIDLKELNEVEPKRGFLTSLKKSFEKLIAKYDNVNTQIESIYIELKNFEKDNDMSNAQLEDMFDACVENYYKTVEYIQAGDEGVKRLQGICESKRSELQVAGEQGALSLELTEAQNACDLLEQRVQDLRMSEQAALQSLPMLKSLIYTNATLNRKVESALVVTLPLFKQNVATALQIKRQAIQARSLQALDDETNRMFAENARNAVEQAKMATRLSGTSALKASTLTESWNTLVTGMEEIKALREQIALERVEDRKQLEALNKDYWEKANS